MYQLFYSRYKSALIINQESDVRSANYVSSPLNDKNLNWLFWQQLWKYNYLLTHLLINKCFFRLWSRWMYFFKNYFRIFFPMSQFSWDSTFFGISLDTSNAGVYFSINCFSALFCFCPSFRFNQFFVLSRFYF